MIHRGYDIPTIAYFESGNIYHGNIGTFRYRIEKAEDQLRAIVWRNDLCYELREDAQEAVFSLNTDGLLSSIDWIEQQHKTANKTAGE